MQWLQKCWVKCLVLSQKSKFIVRTCYSNIVLPDRIWQQTVEELIKF